MNLMLNLMIIQNKCLEKKTEPEPQIEQDPEETGYVTTCGTFAAVPYVKGQYVVIHNGQQIRTCRNITTAKNFINQEKRKLK